MEEACKCNSRFKEFDSFLCNLEIEEHKRMSSLFLQRFGTSSETRGKSNADHIRPGTQDIMISSFELCPVPHYGGLLKTLCKAFLKLGCSSESGRNIKPIGESKQKMNTNLKSGAKKKVKINVGYRAILPKNASFQHSVPVDQMLQEYRDSNMYSKARMRRVDKVAIMNAIHSYQICKQVSTPAILNEPRVPMPREICTQVVNLSFHRELLPVNQQNIKAQVSKEPLHNKAKTSLVKSGTNTKDSYDFEVVIKQLLPNTSTNKRKSQ